MKDADDVVFTVDQVSAASTALRTALGLPPEHFNTATFVGMISDEIQQLRDKGWADPEIAALVHESTGSVMSGDDIAAHYVGPEHRRRQG